VPLIRLAQWYHEPSLTVYVTYCEAVSAVMFAGRARRVAGLVLVPVMCARG